MLTPLRFVLEPIRQKASHLAMLMFVASLRSTICSSRLCTFSACVLPTIPGISTIHGIPTIPTIPLLPLPHNPVRPHLHQLHPIYE
jgi:hypothetical protein